MSERLGLLSLILLAGCAAAPTPTAPAPAPQAQLNDWRVWASPREATALRAALTPHLRAPACFDARVGDALDAAHLLFVREADAAWRRQLAASFARRGEPAYAASAQAAERAPVDHAEARQALAQAIEALGSDPQLAVRQAEELVARFTSLGDPLLGSEAGLVVAVGRLGRRATTPWPAARSRSQRAALAFLRLSEELRTHHRVRPAGFEAAARVALAARHLAVLRGLDALRRVAVGRLATTFARDWSRGLAITHLERGDALGALRFALAAERVSGRDVASRSADRLLRARASLAAGRRDAALAEAQQAAELAHERAPRAAATALAFLGEVLLVCGKLDNAAGAFQRARLGFARSGRPLSAARQQLNLVVTWLKAGELGDAEQALSELAPATLKGAEADALRARVAVVATLLQLVARKRGPQDAVVRLETALESARGAGAYEVVERYSGLVARLKQRARRRS